VNVSVPEGTVTRDRNRVRITAQLIGAAPEKHLWAKKYEGSLEEVLTLQDRVASAVARDRALRWFEKACAEHSMNPWLLPDPRLDSIRSEPRFKDMMRRMGLPQ
jgi:hypothetical protein